MLTDDRRSPELSGARWIATTLSVMYYYLHSIAPALSRLIEPITHSYDRPCYVDDILQGIFSWLSPNDAARAALVCTRWHRSATPAAYSHVVLRFWTPSAFRLARTLSVSAHLRQHVRHLTLICFDPDARCPPLDWLADLPLDLLRSLRVVGPIALYERIATCPALTHAAAVELITLSSREERTADADTRLLYPYQAFAETSSLATLSQQVIRPFYDLHALRQEAEKCGLLIARWSHAGQTSLAELENVINASSGPFPRMNLIVLIAVYDSAWFAHHYLDCFVPTDEPPRAQTTASLRCLCQFEAPATGRTSTPRKAAVSFAMTAGLHTLFSAPLAIAVLSCFLAYVSEDEQPIRGFLLMCCHFNEIAPTDDDCDLCGLGACEISYF
ncbi:hypothetical protein BN946_scf184499.g5 [Trametes cinnabarina]|uniref:F-box domain-containing protein n=1 Tax=Pycnoporus cinnabarinus TaxID=5643 RepID=A0A060S2F0_PYCCI|nr:hypothetical protein BN946_scf184499.g5 [Trametes cinnabarina]